MDSITQIYNLIRSRPVVTLDRLDHFEEQDYRNPLFLAQIKTLAYGEDLPPSESFELQQFIEKVIQKIPGSDNISGFKIISNYLRWKSLPFLNNDQLENLFTQNFVFAIQNGLDPIDLVNRLLITLDDDLGDGGKRAFILKSFRDNQEKIGNNLSQIKINNVSQTNIIKNWLLDYDSLENKEDRGSLEQSEYFVKSTNAKKLNDIDEQSLRVVLKFYDYLKFGPAIPPSFLLEFGPRQQKFVRPIMESNNKVIEDVTIDNSKLSPVVTFVNKVPIALKSPEPAFFFDINDEEEVDKIRNQMAAGKLPIANTLEKNLRVLAEEVIAEHNFQFKDDVSRRRFVQLFVSYMKDVRDLIEVKEVLLKSIMAGGLGLSSDKVEVVAEIFKKLHAQLPQRIKDWARLAPESRIENLESRKPEITTQTLKPLSKPVVEVEKPPVLPAPTVKASQDQLAEWRQELLAEIAKTGVSPKTKPASVKPKLVDVQAPPRVLGPIEELKTMKLMDFRRQGTTVAEVIGKILAKVQLIGETGIGRRLQAVRAWQASPVYQMYLTIGRESIEQAKSAGDVITARQSAGQETLTLAEFESVADLNQKLRF